jgi:hypothetical protein
MHTQFQHLFPTKKRTEQAGEGGVEYKEGEKKTMEADMG